MNNLANPYRFARKLSLRPFFVKDNGKLLRRTFLIAFLLVSVGLVTSGSIELYLRHIESVRNISVLQLEMAESAASKIQQFVDIILRTLQMASQTSDVVTAGITDNYRYQLRKLLRVAPAITSVTVLDATGHEQLKESRVAFFDSGDLSNRSADRAFLQAKAGTPFFGPIYFVRQSEPYMLIAVPIELFVGEVLGILIAEVNLTHIWNVISKIKVGKTGHAYVVSSQGDLIAHPNISLALQKQNLSHLSQVQSALTGVENRITQQSLQGEEVYTSYAIIPDLGWIVFVERLTDAAYAPFAVSLLRLVGLLLFGLIMAGLVSRLIIRRVMRPVEALREGAERLGGGELHHRINIDTGDELQTLAETFNRMAEQLQAFYANLEQQVETRTKELNDSVAELKLLSQHKSQFLAHMSHELRTPLNAIVGYTELLMDDAFGDIPAEAQDNLGRVDSQAKHLLILINTVLDFSRIEAGGYVLRLSDYSLHDLIETTVVRYENAAAAKELTLTMKTANDLPIGRGDQVRLAQVWSNLVGNAITYTEAGGKISIEATALEESVFRVVVTDTGPGIAPENQSRIFNAFEQAHATATRVESGTGLGLSICRTIMELHGGSIGVSSTLGQGSTFWCTFPVRTGDEPYNAS